MQLYSDYYQLIYVVLVVMAGAVLSPFAGRFFNVSISYSLLLYCWHTFFAVIYAVFVVDNGGDAREYYLLSFLDPNFSLGTHAVRLAVSFFSVGLGFPFLACSLVFSFFGYLGGVAFYSSLKEAVRNKATYLKYVIFLLPFLPSLNFWSAGLGKDSLSFFSICMVLWVTLDPRRRAFFVIIPFLMLFIVRPHMAGIMGASFAVSCFFLRGVTVPQRLIVGGAAIVLAAILIPVGLNYAGVEDGADFDNVSDFIEDRQGSNLKGGGAVDISSMSFPEQLFTYFFRPTLLDARNILSLAAALDNLILLCLFVVGGWSLIRKRFRLRINDYNRMFLWIYSGVAWAILAMTTANLGIALRQKWMFAPMLIFLFISAVGRSRSVPVEVAPVVPEGRE